MQFPKIGLMHYQRLDPIAGIVFPEFEEDHTYLADDPEILGFDSPQD
jgi:hypothetical protein